MINLIAVILLVAYAVNVIYVMRKGSLTLGLVFMTLVWTFGPFIGFRLVQDAGFLEANKAVSGLNLVQVIDQVFQRGPEGWASVLMNYLFGAFFGCVMVRTNITSTIIRKTVELGGDRPAITVILLSIVLALISTGVYGTGAMIAMGVIVIPIMLAMGISKVLSVITFIFSCVAGLWINPALQNVYIGFFSNVQGHETYDFQANLTSGIIAMVITLLGTIIGVLVLLNREKKVHAWAAPAEQPAGNRDAPLPALITPVVPALLVIIFKFPVFPAYLLSAVYALAVCRRLKGLDATARELTESFADGMVDTAPMMFFLVSISLFNATIVFARPFLGYLLQPVLPSTTLGIALIVAIFAFLGLFRGPLTLGGSGLATLAIFATGGFNIVFLFPVMMATTMIAHFCCCVTQSWTAWGLSYSKADPKEYLKKSFLPLGWIIIVLLIAAAWIRVG
ncbi:MAG: hypothetical protein LBF78_04550 [Treponema sp.]|jgi:hypothetical protein|nr:hypothetical protein [Treponema sp.]